MKFAKILLGIAFVLAGAGVAFAQSSPGLTYGQVPTAGQWNSYFAAKQDVLGYTPLNQAGGTMLGPLKTAPSTISAAGFSLLPGVAPNLPNNGDVWLTSSGLYYRAGNITFGPIGSGTITGPATSVAGNVATWNNTIGTALQDSGKALPSGAFVGTTDPQTLDNKSLTSPNLLTSFQVNGTLTWPSTFMPGFSPSMLTGYIVDAKGSNSTVFAATRTSDNTGSGRQNVIADTCLVVPDNTVNAQVASWCRYEQANIPATSNYGLHINDENSIENKAANAPQTDPFSNFATGGKVIENLRLNAGVGNTGVNNTSNYMSMLYNGGLAYSGIVVGSGALDTSSGYAPAISMPPNVGLSWYNSAGDRSWRIFNNAFSGHGQIILGNDTWNLYLGNGGYNALNITTTGIGINKTAAYSLDVNGAAKASQFLSTAGTQVLSACGTSPSMAANSSKHGGRFSTGTGTVTSCTLTFDTPFPTAAFCSISPVGATSVAQQFYISSQTNTAFTLTFGASAPSTSYQYVCMGD